MKEMDDFMSKFAIYNVSTQPPEELERRFEDILPHMNRYTKGQIYIFVFLNSMLDAGVINETDYRKAMNAIQDAVIKMAREKRQQGGTEQ